MKRKNVFIAIAAIMASGASAQDTLWQKPAPLDNYYYTNWLDTTQRYAVAWDGRACEVNAKQFVTKDTLQVYGIAAMMTNIDYYSYLRYPSFYTTHYPSFQAYLDSIYPEYPTLDSCEESLLLYQYHGIPNRVMQQVGDSLPVHFLHTPVTHWFMSNTQPVSNQDTFPKPLYERYFELTQTVYDTFYVGYTQSQYRKDTVYDDFLQDTCIIYRQVRPGFQIFCFTSTPSMITGYDENAAFFRQNKMSRPPEWTFQNTGQVFSLYIFPILTPNPDTTGTPTDTTRNPTDTTVNPTDTTGVGIHQVDMVYRYTTVAPNPARERVTVTSSFGLGRIEAYDERGTRIHDAKASGYKATLDVSAWPRGAYLLRITTGAGPTVKKLLVQ